MKRKSITLPRYAVAMLTALPPLLGLLLWSEKRRRRPRLDFDYGGGLRELLPSIVGLTHGTLVEGNRIELLQNGRYFDVLFHDLDAAKETIDIETFLCKRGEVTRRIAEVLVGKARDGIAVRVLLDARGDRRFG